MTENGTRHFVHTTTHVSLSFWDRVRVLFGARLTVFVESTTERDPGHAFSSSSVQIGRLFAKASTVSIGAEPSSDDARGDLHVHFRCNRPEPSRVARVVTERLAAMRRHPKSTREAP